MKHQDNCNQRFDRHLFSWAVPLKAARVPNSTYQLLMAIALLAGLALAQPAQAGESCQEWFSGTDAVPGTSDCESDCVTAPPTDINTRKCRLPALCHRYCTTFDDTIFDDKALGSCQSGTAFAGDPINIATGNTFEQVTDYTPGANQDPAVERYYNSGSSVAQAHLGAHWRSSFSASVDRDDDRATLYRPNGQALVFTRSDDEWRADGDVTGKLQSVGGTDASGGWRYDTPNNTVERYDAGGRLVEEKAPGRYDWTLTYDSDRQLSRVASATGRDLTFTHDGQGRITKITLPDGGIIEYGYDSHDNLSDVSYPTGSGQSSIAYQYDNDDHPHALTGQVDENGAPYTHWTYDDDGRATSSAHAEGADKTTFDYADDSTTVTNALGRETTYKFTVIQGVPRITHVEGHPTSTCAGANKDYHYTHNGRIAYKTDWNDNTTEYTYDDRGLQTSRTKAPGLGIARTIKTSWSKDFRRPTKIDTPRHSTRFHYDNAGRLTERTITDTGSGNTRTWTYTYAANHNGLPGKVHTIDGPRSDVDDTTTFTYNSHGDLRQVTDPLGHITKITDHDASGRPLTLVDANGVNTQLTYDSRGRLIRRTRNGATLTFRYDPAGDITRIEQPDGSELDFKYDDAHRLVRISDAQGDRIDYTLDAAGNRTATRVRDPNGTIRYRHDRTFDALSRLIKSLGADDGAATYAYDANGNRVKATDPLGNETDHTYDPFDRLRKTTNALGGSASYEYWESDSDQPSAASDPRNTRTEYSYDGFGKPTTIDSDDSGQTQLAYDAAGNLIQRTDARGVVTEYTYDADNRLTEVHFPDSSHDDFTYGYDDADSAHGIGRLTSASDARGTAHFGYDGWGYLQTIDRTIHGTDYLVQATHNATGDMTGLTYPSGLVVNYTYDANGQVSDIDMAHGDVDQVLAQKITHAPFGNETGLIYGNGQTLSRQYDKNGRLTELSAPDVVDTTYTYDADGHLTARTDADNDQASFSYDALSRLTGAEGVIDDALSYTYDDSGNRTKKTIGDNTHDYGSWSNNWLVGIYLASSYKDIDYDEAGLPTRWGDLRLNYDANGRLSIVKNADGDTLGHYGYDGFGRRIAKSAGGLSRYFIYGPANHLLGVYTRDGTALREFVWADGRLLAVIKQGTPYYVITNAIGAPIAVTNASKEVVWRWHPLPFGGGAVDDDPDGDGKAFTLQQRLPGQYADAETGFYANGFRDYDPASGRYLEPDPIGLAGGINPYVYAGNNPLVFVDPFGLSPFSDAAYNFAGGALDTASFGLASLPNADSCSLSYNLGIAATIVPGLLDGAGEAELAGLAGRRGASALAHEAEGLAKGAGRSGKQARLRELANDDKFGSADRGWIKQEMNSIERGQRKSIRNPPGKDLAHERGREAAKGYRYEHSNLQDRDLHRLQHKYDNFGKKNKERPPQ